MSADQPPEEDKPGFAGCVLLLILAGLLLAGLSFVFPRCAHWWISN
jgi:hypothetical protein